MFLIFPKLKTMFLQVSTLGEQNRQITICSYLLSLFAAHIMRKE